MPDLTSKYKALLEMLKVVALSRDPHSLLDTLSGNLHAIVHFESFNILLYDSIEERMTFVSSGKSYKFDDCFALEDDPSGWTVAHQKPLFCSMNALKLRFPKIDGSIWRENDLQSICVLPLTTSQRQLGSMIFINAPSNFYSEEDVSFIQRVASHIAIALDNALNYEQFRIYEEKVRLERHHYLTLTKTSDLVVSKLDIEELVENFSRQIFESFAMERTCVLVHDHKMNLLRAYPLSSNPSLIAAQEVSTTDPSPWGNTFREKQRHLFRKAELESLARSHSQIAALIERNIEAMCCLPLVAHNTCTGVLIVAHKDERAFGAQTLEALDIISYQLAITIENSLRYQEVCQLKDRLASEKLYLEEEIRTDHNFGEIIGQSDVLQKLLAEVDLVAAGDCTALIYGETGTGKELIARAIHRLSKRRDRALVKFNCAAIPEGLFESELFGHEKGAFTGAVAQKIGRLELAQHGTLFFDEVGEIPLELQPKLLRAIQEREIERLGGTRVIPLDARIIAATNRDLKQMVADHQFRSDLYYRLNVFPLRVPPLRERQADIPLLVRHFAQKSANRMKRNIDRIPAESMRILCEYSWPGNIRELEHIIERSVILSKGPILNVPLSELIEVDQRYLDDGSEESNMLTFHRPPRTERDLIVKALNETGGVIAGPKGAAAKLGLKRSTLISRMKRLGL